MILLISSLKITLKHNYHLSDSQTLKIVEVRQYREDIREKTRADSAQTIVYSDNVRQSR